VAQGGSLTVWAGRDGDGEEAVVRISAAAVDWPAGGKPAFLGRFADLLPLVDQPGGDLLVALLLMRNLVELHGGSVSVSGPELVVRLPLVSEVSEVPGPVEPARIGPLATARRILVVEDNRDGREALRMLLRMWGYEVEAAEDGRQAVQKAMAVRPEVALIDIGLPGLDGYEVARRVRSLLGRDVFLVAITGYGEPHDRRRALEAGFDAHLVKPLAPESLRELLFGDSST
jgi:CheY-like chemotaxis protein